MLFALIARDKPDALEIRMETRPAHVDYLKSTDAVVRAGPLLDAAEQMVGSLIVLDLPDMTAAKAWAANDPYAKAGLFQSVEIIRWTQVIGS